MRKIELNLQTAGLIKDRLAKATAGMFTCASAYNQHPLRLKNVFNEFTMTMAKGVRVITYRDAFPVIKHETALLHLVLDASTEMHFVYGDLFYFKGKQIYIDSKKNAMDMQSRAPHLKRDRFVERFSILKYDHQLSIKEIWQAQDYHEEADETHRQFVEATVNEWIY